MTSRLTPASPSGTSPRSTQRSWPPLPAERDVRRPTVRTLPGRPAHPPGETPVLRRPTELSRVRVDPNQGDGPMSKYPEQAPTPTRHLFIDTHDLTTAERERLVKRLERLLDLRY